MIEGRNVCKIFKDFWGRPKVSALKGLDILVREGMIFGLLGPNGAGKSTLIKVILGHLYPSSGAIEVLGRSPRDVEVKSRIGYMSERPSFYPTLSANETLMFFSRLLGIPGSEAKRRIAQLLPMVGLNETGTRSVGEFSYGMKKRLALAQSLLNDPDLLLLDEPTAGLDPLGCREVKDLIMTLGRRGKTVLMTSHLLADMQDLCDTIMIVYAGKAQAYGSIKELLAKKDEILIRTAPQPKDSLDRIELIAREAAPSAPFEISHPSRTLEDYFLSVVKGASENAGSIGGAKIGSGVAEYLSSSTKLDAFEHEDFKAPPIKADDKFDNAKEKAQAEPKAPLATENVPPVDLQTDSIKKPELQDSRKSPKAREAATASEASAVDEALLSSLTRKEK